MEIYPKLIPFTLLICSTFVSQFQTALVSPTNDEYEYILETIKETVEEGQGETIYEIGTGGEQSF